MAIAARRLNYQHLLYFWAVVRAGSLTKACEELHLSAPTVSAQLRTFETRIGEKLLAKSGRTLVPTEVGRLVFSYAEEIFGLGGDLLNALAHRPTQRPLRLVVGIDDVLPKEIAQRLIEGALDLDQPTQLTCREGSLEHLLAALRTHEVDIVLSDSPVTPSVNDRAYNHCSVPAGHPGWPHPRWRSVCGEDSLLLAWRTDAAADSRHCDSPLARSVARQAGRATAHRRRVRGLRTATRVCAGGPRGGARARCTRGTVSKGVGAGVDRRGGQSGSASSTRSRWSARSRTRLRSRSPKRQVGSFPPEPKRGLTGPRCHTNLFGRCNVSMQAAQRETRWNRGLRGHR